MRMDKLTSKFQMALADAQSLALGKDHQFIEPSHLMVAMLDQQGGSTRQLLAKAGVNVNLLRSRLGDSLDHIASVTGVGGDIHLSNDLGKLLNQCDKLAQKRNDSYISTYSTTVTQGADPTIRGSGLINGNRQSKMAMTLETIPSNILVQEISTLHVKRQSRIIP